MNGYEEYIYNKYENFRYVFDISKENMVDIVKIRNKVIRDIVNEKWYESILQYKDEYHVSDKEACNMWAIIDVIGVHDYEAFTLRTCDFDEELKEYYNVRAGLCDFVYDFEDEEIKESGKWKN